MTPAHSLRRRITARFVVLFVCAALLGLRATSADGAGPTQVGKRWAVLIGVDTYANLDKQRHCGADQRALRDVLLNTDFPASNVALLMDAAPDPGALPTRANVERQLTQTLARAEKDDLVVITFSGHATVLDGKGYFCLSDAERNAPTTLLSIDALYERLQSCRAAVKLLIVDACRAPLDNGAAPSTTYPLGVGQWADALLQRTLPTGVALFHSCSQGEHSHDDGVEKRGIYLNSLLNGLKGAADADKNGMISLMELQAYVGSETRKAAADKLQVLQRPFVRSDLPLPVLESGLLSLPSTKPVDGSAPTVSNAPMPPTGANDVGSASPAVPSALAGRRDGALKTQLLKEHGGTEESEAAVTAGLKWLAAHQLPNGLWSLTGEAQNKSQKYSAGSKFENEEAAAALAMLAFLGAGHAPKSGGAFSANVAKGMKALIVNQDPSGNFFRGKKVDDAMYTHAMCTIALCECLAFDPADAKLRASCEKGVKYCLDAQHELGGWRYRPRSDSDTSVTGWVLMALETAKLVKIPVPQKVLDDVSGYLDRAAARIQRIERQVGVPLPQPKADLIGARYGYQPGMDSDHVMTAVAMLCRMHLGWPRDEKRLEQGCDFLLKEHLPDWSARDVYYWYYATQTLFHMQGERWKKWNAPLRDTLIEHQEKAGPEAGSWDPLGAGFDKSEGADLWSMNQTGGRLYVTCFSLFDLEVYYRHRPLYAEAK